MSGRCRRRSTRAECTPVRARGPVSFPTSLQSLLTAYTPRAGLLYNTEGLPYFGVGMGQLLRPGRQGSGCRRRPGDHGRRRCRQGHPRPGRAGRSAGRRRRARHRPARRGRTGWQALPFFPLERHRARASPRRGANNGQQYQGGTRSQDRPPVRRCGAERARRRRTRGGAALRVPPHRHGAATVCRLAHRDRSRARERLRNERPGGRVAPRQASVTGRPGRAVDRPQWTCVAHAGQGSRPSPCGPLPGRRTARPDTGFSPVHKPSGRTLAHLPTVPQTHDCCDCVVRPPARGRPLLP